MTFRRSLQLAGAFVCGSQLALAQSAPVLPAAVPSAGVQRQELAASESFELGLALARASRYEEARAQFLLAYRASPHYLVLYNIAQCEKLLGRTARAAEWLQRYLSEGGQEIEPAARHAAELELKDLRERLAGEPVPSVSSSAPAQPAGAQPVAPPVRREVASSEAHGSTLGWALGGTGAVLLAGALGLYLWNDGRHDDWQRERRALNGEDELQLQLARDPELWARARRNNALLEGIQRVDTVSGVAAGVGVLALGAGLWQLLLPAGSGLGLAARPGPELSWSTRW